MSHQDSRITVAHRLLAPASWTVGQRQAALIASMIACLAYFYLVPAPLLALPGLLIFAVLAWGRLDLALALLPLTFPFWYVPKRLFNDKVFPLSEIVLAVCVALALAHLVQVLWRRHWRLPARAWALSHIRVLVRRVGPLTIASAVLFVLGVSLGVLVARRRPEALRAWRWEVAEPLLYFMLLLIYGRSQRALALLIWSFLGSALLVALLALAQTLWLHVTITPLAHGNRLVAYSAPRATAIIYGSSNSLGAWLARAVPLALALACARTAEPRLRLAALLLALLYLPALVWSDSRGAWIAAALACLVVVCVLSRWMRLVALALAPVCLVIALWQRVALSNLLLQGHGGSGEVRTLLWQSSWHMIRDHFVFGIGPDQFLYYYSNLYTSHPYWIPKINGHITPAFYQPDLSHPHNLLLDLWLSGGLLALVGFLVLLFVVAQQSWRIWRTWQRRTIAQSDTSPAAVFAAAGLPTGPLALGIAASVLAGVVHGMVDSAYFASDLALAFWWALAALLLLARLVEYPHVGK
jgi:O-antigen ligase